MSENELAGPSVGEPQTQIQPQDNGIESESYYDGQKSDDKPVAQPDQQEAEKPADPDGQAEEQPKKPSGSAKARHQNQYLRDHNAALEAEIARLKGQSQPPAGQEQSNGQPLEKDFDNVMDFLRADAEWVADQKLENYKAQQTQAQETAALNAAIETHIEREDSYSEQHADYDDLIDNYRDSGFLTQNIQKAVLQSPMSHEVAHYLAKYDGDAQAIYQMERMGNLQGGKEAVRDIEAFVKANPMQSAVKQTQASAPIVPPRSNSAAGDVKDKYGKGWTQEDVEKAMFKPRK